MNEMTTYRWSFLDDVVHYGRAGVDAIGIWRPKLVEFGEERGIELIRDSGLAVASVSWAGGFTGTNGHSFRDSLDDGISAVHLAAQLNADSLVVLTGARAGHTYNHAVRIVRDAVRQMADLAGLYGLTLAVQPMHRLFAREWTFLNTIDSTLELLDRINHPRVGMAFDVYHLWQEARLKERIAEIAPHVSIVQLSDWKCAPRSENDRCLPGEGKIPLAEIVQAFHQAGYRGFFDLQVWSEDVWNSDYCDVLETCHAHFQSLCTYVKQTA